MLSYHRHATGHEQRDAPALRPLPALQRKKLTIISRRQPVLRRWSAVAARGSSESLAICPATCRRNARPARCLAASEQHGRADHDARLRHLCGHKDGNDLDRLKHDPLLKMAPSVGRRRAARRWPRSRRFAAGEYAEPNDGGAADRRPRRSVLRLVRDPVPEITLDIDDTVDEVHGGQQLVVLERAL